MGKNIVMLSGSPRNGGNTDTLAAAFAEGAAAAGHSVKNFRVADMKLSPCLGCGNCRANAVCVHRDDMPLILHELRFADALVLATPIYYFNVSAQLKTALDRMFALLNVPKPIKKLALLVTCADESEETAEAAAVMYKRLAAYEKWEEAGIVVAAGLSGNDKIHSHAALEEARKLGGSI